MTERSTQPPETPPQPDQITFNVRLIDERVREGLRLEDLLLLDRSSIAPWRPPACFKHQQNLPGYFWMSQTRQLIFYESRLEMTVLKRIDFEEKVAFVVPQPFELHFRVGASKRRHVPDFLVWRVNADPLLVNVKPLAYMDKARNRDSFAACQAIGQRIKLQHRVYNEPESLFLANVRWLAGFRREPILIPQAAPPLMDRLSNGPLPFGEWIRGIGEEALVLPAAFHLLWKRRVEFKQSVLLGSDSLVWCGK